MKRIVIAISALLLESIVSVDAMYPNAHIVQEAIQKTLQERGCLTAEQEVQQMIEQEISRTMNGIMAKMSESMLRMRDNMMRDVNGIMSYEYKKIYRKYICPCKPAGYNLPIVSDIKVYGHEPIASCDPTQSYYRVNIYSIVDFESGSLLVSSYRKIVEELMPESEEKRNWLLSNDRVQSYFTEARQNTGLQSLLSYSLSFDKSGSYPLFQSLCKIENPGDLISFFTYDHRNNQGIDESIYFDNFCMMRCHFAKNTNCLPEFINVFGQNARGILFCDRNALSNLEEILCIMGNSDFDRMEDFCNFINGYNLNNVMKLFYGNSTNGDLDVNIFDFIDFARNFLDVNHFDVRAFMSNVAFFADISEEFNIDIARAIINTQETRDVLVQLLSREPSEQNNDQMCNLFYSLANYY